MKLLDNIEFNNYKTEVKEKWGNTDAYIEHVAKTKNYTKDKWDNLAEVMNDIFSEFASCMKNGETTDSIIVQNLVKKLQNHISENYYQCSKEILSGLGKMYVADERFKNNIDKHANGTAAYVCEAIQMHCKK